MMMMMMVGPMLPKYSDDCPPGFVIVLVESIVASTCGVGMMSFTWGSIASILDSWFDPVILQPVSSTVSLGFYLMTGVKVDTGAQKVKVSNWRIITRHMM